MTDTNIPESWCGFENFVSVESTQGWVWRGADMRGTVAYLKRHRSAASFDREWHALQLIEGYDIGPKVLAVNPLERMLLTACAGVRFESQRACTQTSEQCVETLSRLHHCPTPLDEVSVAEAMSMRWRRLHRRLGAHCPDDLAAWIGDRLSRLPEVPRTIVHRDLRPSHWFFNGGRARLIDFGQARVDAVLFDAIPFYTQQYPDVISDKVCSYFEAKIWTTGDGESGFVRRTLFVRYYRTLDLSR